MSKRKATKCKATKRKDTKRKDTKRKDTKRKDTKRKATRSRRALQLNRGGGFVHECYVDELAPGELDNRTRGHVHRIA